MSNKLKKKFTIWGQWDDRGIIKHKNRPVYISETGKGDQYTLKYLWKNIKKFNISIIVVPEGERGKKAKYLKK